MISDDPSACTTRHATNNSTLGDTAAATDARVKRLVPASNACFAPHRRANEEPITSVAAPTMVKMLTAHDNVADDECGNESSRSGKTTNTIESAIDICRFVKPTVASVIQARRICARSARSTVVIGGSCAAASPTALMNQTLTGRTARPRRLGRPSVR